MLAVVGVLTGILALLLTVTTLAAVPDDLERTGRAVQVVCGDGSVSRVGPGPGVFYSAPAALVIVVGLLLGTLTIRRVAGWPRVGPDAASRLADDEIRRHPGRMVVAACGLLVAGPLTGIALVSGSVLLYSCGSVIVHLTGWTLVATGIATLGAFWWLAASMLFVRLPRRSIGET